MRAFVSHHENDVALHETQLAAAQQFGFASRIRLSHHGIFSLTH
jgi:hypothetical protein